MAKIPTQIENPNGFHQRYHIQKVEVIFDGYDLMERPKYRNELHDVDAGSEYFVMRLDDGGKDPEHIKACRIGVNAYADAIEHHLPELAKDLRERYPLPSKPVEGERGVEEIKMKALKDLLEINEQQREQWAQMCIKKQKRIEDLENTLLQLSITKGAGGK